MIPRMRWSRERRALRLLVVLLVIGPGYGCGDQAAQGDGPTKQDEPAEPQEDDVCARATQHVFELIEGTGPVQGPERLVMDGIVIAARNQCREEGLSPAQAECIFAVKSAADLTRLGQCEAIAASPPRWLRLPPP